MTGPSGVTAYSAWKPIGCICINGWQEPKVRFNSHSHGSDPSSLAGSRYRPAFNWLGDRWALGGAALTGCVCFSFLLQAFLGMIQSTVSTEELAQHLRHTGSEDGAGWACVHVILGILFCNDEAQLDLLHKWGTRALPRITLECQLTKSFTGKLIRASPQLSYFFISVGSSGSNLLVHLSIDFDWSM